MKIILKRSFFLIIYIFLIAVSCYLFKQDDIYNKFILMISFLVYLFIVTSIFILNGNFKSLDKVIGLSFVLYSLPIPIYILTGGRIEEVLGFDLVFSELYNIELVTKFVFLCIVFISSFYSGYLICSLKNNDNLNLEKQIIKEYNFKFSLLFIYFWIILGLSIFLYGILKINYLSAIGAGYSLSNVGYVYLFSGVFIVNSGYLIIFGIRKFNKGHFIIPMVVHLILVPLGIRQLTLTFILQIIILCVFVYKVNIKDIMQKYIVFLIIGLWGFGIIGSLRSGNDLSSLTINDIMLGPIKFYFYETTFNALSTLKLLKIQDLVDQNYIYGGSLIDPIMSLIPSFILPNKSEYMFFENFIAKYSGYENLKPVGTAHILTELYANGGIYFIVIFAFLLGIIMRMLQKKMENTIRTKNITAMIFFASIIPFILIQFNRGGLDILIKLIIQFSILPLLIVCIFRKNRG